MIQKLIRSKADQTLNTSIELYMLSQDEVRWIRFKNDEQFKELCRMGHIEEAHPSTPLQKPIPVLYPQLVSATSILQSRGVSLPVPRTLPEVASAVPLESGVDALLQRMRGRVGQK